MAKKLTDLQSDPVNFNKHTEAGMKLIEKSMRQFGFVEAGLISEDNVICSGNARQETAVGIGMVDVQIIDIDGTKPVYLRKKGLQSGTQEFKELALALNATAKANILLDVQMIEAELGEAITQEWGVELSGKEDAQEDEFEIPEEVKTSIKLGDRIEIGPHRLVCGDSTTKSTFAKLFGEEVADMVLTDPPYNVALGMETQKEAKARNRRTDQKVIKNDKMSDADFYQFLFNFYSSMAAYTKAGGPWYVWHADSEVINFRKAMADAGIMPKQGLVWEKSSLVMGRQDYQWQHEPCLYGWKEGAAHPWYTDRKQSTILKFDKPSRNPDHPTMKPIPLFAYQIGNSSKQGDIVADPFGGSGTTMVACHQMNRKAYLVEYDPKYCQVIILRMLALDPTLIVKINGKTYKEGGANVKAK